MKKNKQNCYGVAYYQTPNPKKLCQRIDNLFQQPRFSEIKTEIYDDYQETIDDFSEKIKNVLVERFGINYIQWEYFDVFENFEKVKIKTKYFPRKKTFPNTGTLRPISFFEG